jgi:hypothetical protein
VLAAVVLLFLLVMMLLLVLLIPLFVLLALVLLRFGGRLMAFGFGGRAGLVRGQADGRVKSSAVEGGSGEQGRDEV